MRRLELSFFLVLLSISVGCIYELFFRRDDTGRAHIVATLEELQKTVRTRSESSLIWRDAAGDWGVSSGDSIFVGPGSSAILRSSYGTKLELDSNTLLKYRQVDGKDVFQVDQGVLSTRIGNRPVVLKIAGKEIELEGKEVSVQLEALESGGKVSILSGELQIAGEKVNSERRLEIKGGKIELAKNPFAGALPASGTIHYSKGIDRIPFSIPNSLRDLKIEIKKGKKRRVLIVPESENKIFAKLGLGSYQWRFISNKEVSPWYRLVLKSPPRAHVSLFRSRIRRGEQLVASTAPQSPFDIEWQVSGVSKLSIRGSDFVWRLPNDWSATSVRIRSRYVYRNVTGKWSSWSGLVVESKEGLLPDFVLPSPNEQVASFNGRYKLSFALSGAAPVGSDLRINGVTQSFVVANKRQFQLSFDKSGDFVVQLCFQTQCKDRKVHVKMYALNDFIPNNGANRIELLRPGQGLEFRWNAVGREPFIFEFARDRDFKKIVSTRKVKGDLLQIPFPGIGTYYWRVRVPGGDEVASKPSALRVMPVAIPEAPKLPPVIRIRLRGKSWKWSIFSDAHASQGALVEGTKLRWPRDSRAKSFEVDIRLDLSDQSEAIILQDNAIDFASYSPGRYHLRIRILDHWGRWSEYSEWSEVIVTKERKVEAKAGMWSSTFLDQSYESSRILENFVDIGVGIGPVKWERGQNLRSRSQVVSGESSTREQFYGKWKRGRFLAHTQLQVGTQFETVQFISLDFLAQYVVNESVFTRSWWPELRAGPWFWSLQSALLTERAEFIKEQESAVMARADIGRRFVALGVDQELFLGIGIGSATAYQLWYQLSGLFSSAWFVRMQHQRIEYTTQELESTSLSFGLRYDYGH